MSLYQHFGLTVGLIILSVVLIWLARRMAAWIRWVNYAAIAGNGIVALFYGSVIIDNAIGGCYPWSPAEVEYYDGMTLCPGQSAMIKIEVIP